MTAEDWPFQNLDRDPLTGGQPERVGDILDRLFAPYGHRIPSRIRMQPEPDEEFKATLAKVLDDLDPVLRRLAPHDTYVPGEGIPGRPIGPDAEADEAARHIEEDGNG